MQGPPQKWDDLTPEGQEEIRQRMAAYASTSEDEETIDGDGEGYDLEELETEQEKESRFKMLTNPLRQEQEYTEPVLFEPVQEIRLSLSSYQISSLFSFEPYIKSMENLAQYGIQMREDLNTFIISSEQTNAVRFNIMFPQLYAEQEALEAELKLVFQMESEFHDTIDLMKPREDRNLQPYETRKLPGIPTPRGKIQQATPIDMLHGMDAPVDICMGRLVQCTNNYCKEKNVTCNKHCQARRCFIRMRDCIKEKTPLTQNIASMCFERYNQMANLKCSDDRNNRPEQIERRQFGDFQNCLYTWIDGQFHLGNSDPQAAAQKETQTVAQQVTTPSKTKRSITETKEKESSHVVTMLEKGVRKYGYGENFFLDSEGSLRPDSIYLIYKFIAQLCKNGDSTIWYTHPEVCEEEFQITKPMNTTDLLNNSKHIRQKRFLGLLALAGVGIHMLFTHNSRRKMKERIKELDRRTKANRADILENYNMINLTKIELGEHRKLLHKLDMFTLQLNNTVERLIAHVDFSDRVATTLHSVRTKISIMRSGRETVRYDLGLLFKYLDTMAHQILTPTLIAPADLREILLHAQEAIRNRPRLKLPTDPTDKLWEYYTYLKIVPVVMNNYLIVVLQVPLVDISTTFQVYEIFNLPALHPKLGIAYQYVLESNFLVVSSDQHYFMMPLETDVMACKLTRGHWCKMRTAMYPVAIIDWCIASLFINDKERIERTCSVKTLKRYNNIAYDLGKGLWAISASASTPLQIDCLKGSEHITVEPPLQIIHLENGCGAVSTGRLFIPASTTIEVQTSDNLLVSKRFMGFTKTYVPLTELHMYKNLTFDKLTSEQVEELTTKLSKYDEIPMPDILKEFEEIDYSDDFWLSGLLKWGLIIGGIVILIVIIGVIIWCTIRYKLGRTLIPENLYGVLPSSLAQHAVFGKSPTSSLRRPSTVKFSKNLERVDLDMAEDIELKPLKSRNKPPTLKPQSQHSKTVTAEVHAPMTPRTAKRKTVRKLLLGAKQELADAKEAKRIAQAEGVSADEYEPEYEIAKATAINIAKKARQMTTEL